MDEANRAYLQLQPKQDYHYLNQGSCFEIPGVSDSEELYNTLEAMGTVGFTEDERFQIMSCMVAILHLGNITFEEIVGPDGQAASMVAGDAMPSLEAASRLLNVSAEEMANNLVIKELVVRVSILSINYPF